MSKLYTKNGKIARKKWKKTEKNGLFLYLLQKYNTFVLILF